MNIIVGLGNPGAKYELTRHNTGFIVLNELARQEDAVWKFNKKFNAEAAEIKNALLLKPQTFMNNSGRTTRAVLDYYKLLPKRLGVFNRKDANLSGSLIIIHDDADIELGKFKAQSNRSAAGHRGVQSVINDLKTQNFARVRIGVSTAQKKIIGTEKFILQKFPREELDGLKKIIPAIIDELLEKIKEQNS